MNKLLRNILVALSVLILGIVTFLFRDPITQKLSSVVQSDSPVVANSQTELPSSKMTYGHFLEYVDMGWVTKVDFYENGHRAIVETSSPELGNRAQRIQVDIPTGASSQLITKLKTTSIDFDAHGSSSQVAMRGLIAKISLPIITIALVSFLVRRRNNNENNNGNNQGWGPFNGMGGPFGGFNGGPFNLRRTKRNFKVDLKTGIGFEDVAGVDEVKEEFQEVVDFLKTPEKFTELGAKVPRGVLLVGPPGTGKTLLAKAIAGEAGVPFMSISGSEFVEMFVGIGASRVRDAFKEAKKNAPCIVFIDEIDAVGRQRGAGVGGGNDEREQTLNQLLTEMDGFEGNSGIIVIAATNRVDTLDAALLRPGRFDRQISVNLPDLNGRLEILKIHARNKNLASDVKLKRIAQRTPGFSGADLENILNEASILTARRNETIITQQDVNKSIERIIAGLEGNALLDTKNKRLVAYHEVGHAIVATMLKYHDPVEKVTIIPRGQASGLTWFTPLEDQGLISRGQILARIAGALGGRVAEDLIFGNTEITTGANNDIRQVTSMARQMVTRYGMSKIGPIAFEAQPTPVFLTGRFRNRKNIPSETAVKIDTVVQEIISQCYDEAKFILMQNREAMDRIVDILMDKETLDGDLFRKILSEYTELPKNIAVNYESYFSQKSERELAQT